MPLPTIVMLGLGLLVGSLWLGTAIHPAHKTFADYPSPSTAESVEAP